MGHKVTDKESLHTGSSGYLFFQTPKPELWQGNTRGETHESILTSSGRLRRNVAVAGGMSVWDDGVIIIDAEGSGTLSFPKKSALRVVEFVKMLSGVNTELVESI